MSGLSEVYPAPRCDFIHAQALELNDLYTRRAEYVERAMTDQLRDSVATRKLGNIETELSDSILRREFMTDGIASPVEEFDEISLQSAWSIWNNISQWTRSQVGPDSLSSNMLRRLDEAEARHDARMVGHIKRWHRFGNDECYQDGDWHPPIHQFAAATRIMGGFLLRSVHFPLRKRA